MTQPTQRRSVANKARKKRDALLLLNLVLLILIITGGLFLWKEYRARPNQASTPKISQVSQSTSSKEANDSTPTSKAKENIKWVKQDQPIKLPILMYHAIHDMAPSEAANAGLIVSPVTFESHLKALKEAGYYTLSPDEAYKVLTENILPENKKIIWLTFDDSLKDFYTQAYPILQKYQMKATNNVITGFVQAGREDILTMEEIKEMKQNGMSFEDHTVNHPDLSVSSPDAQNSELQDSKQFLDSNLSQTTTTVAYPSGRYSETTMQIAEKLGYKMGLTTNNGLASLSNGLLSLNRVRVNPTTTAQSLLDEIRN